MSAPIKEGVTRDLFLEMARGVNQMAVAGGIVPASSWVLSAKYRVWCEKVAMRMLSHLMNSFSMRNVAAQLREALEREREAPVSQLYVLRRRTDRLLRDLEVETSAELHFIQSNETHLMEVNELLRRAVAALEQNATDKEYIEGLSYYDLLEEFGDRPVEEYPLPVIDPSQWIIHYGKSAEEATLDADSRGQSTNERVCEPQSREEETTPQESVATDGRSDGGDASTEEASAQERPQTEAQDSYGPPIA